MVSECKQGSLRADRKRIAGRGEWATHRPEEVSQPPDDLGRRARVRGDDEQRLGEDQALPDDPEAREDRGREEGDRRREREGGEDLRASGSGRAFQRRVAVAVRKGQGAELTLRGEGGSRGAGAGRKMAGGASAPYVPDTDRAMLALAAGAPSSTRAACWRDARLPFIWYVGCDDGGVSLLTGGGGGGDGELPGVLALLDADDGAEDRTGVGGADFRPRRGRLSALALALGGGRRSCEAWWRSGIWTVNVSPRNGSSSVAPGVGSGLVRGQTQGGVSVLRASPASRPEKRRTRPRSRGTPVRAPAGRAQSTAARGTRRASRRATGRPAASG